MEENSGDLGYSEESKNKKWNEQWWPAMSLFFNVRFLHSFAMQHISKIKEGDKVLEVGSGYPFYKLYSEKVGEDGLFVALDVNENIQGRSKKLLYWLHRLTGNKKSKEEVLAGDATQLPFPDNSFNVVMANNFTGSKEYISEAYRVLKPGGRFVTSTLEIDLKRTVANNRAAICQKNGFEEVNIKYASPGAIIPGILGNWYVEAVKPN